MSNPNNFSLLSLQQHKKESSMVKLQHLKFPYKLHYLLEEASQNEGLSGIVSWLPCGTAFTVHDAYAFANLILPTYFPGMASYRSFRRQLNLYGITQGNNKGPGSLSSNGTGVYSHPFLVRSRRDLCGMIQRRKNASNSSPPAVRSEGTMANSSKGVENDECDATAAQHHHQEEVESINLNSIAAPVAVADGSDVMFKNLFMDDGFNLSFNMSNALNNLMGGAGTAKERFTTASPEVHHACQPIQLVSPNLLFPNNNNLVNMGQLQNNWLASMQENSVDVCLDVVGQNSSDEPQKQKPALGSRSLPDLFSTEDASGLSTSSADTQKLGQSGVSMSTSALRNPLSDLFSMEDEIIWTFMESST